MSFPRMISTTKTGSEITRRQNEQISLKLLAAQRRLYIDEKLLFGWQLSLALLNAIIGALIALLPAMNNSVICAGLLVTVINESLGLFIGKKRKQAACIQEQFDCYVLDLPWNDLHVGPAEPPETIERVSKRYTPRLDAPLENWYLASFISFHSMPHEFFASG